MGQYTWHPCGKTVPMWQYTWPFCGNMWPMQCDNIRDPACDKKGPMRLTFYKKCGQFVHFPSRDQHDTMRDQWSLINHPVERRDKCDQAAAKRTLPKWSTFDIRRDQLDQPVMIDTTSIGRTFPTCDHSLFELSKPYSFSINMLQKTSSWWTSRHFMHIYLF